jgi:hypothetical protein
VSWRNDIGRTVDDRARGPKRRLDAALGVAAL